MGKSAGSAPQAPDPNVVIPLQTQANKDAFDYMLQQQRATSITPGGTQSWSQNTSPDTAGYNAALAAYNQKKSALDSQYTSKPSAVFSPEGGGNSAGPMLNVNDKNYKKALAALLSSACLVKYA